MTKPITLKTLLNMKRSGERIAMMTAYDHPTAKLLEQAGMHVLLVGDSLGMVVHGEKSTLHVTLEDIIYHTKMVTRAVERTFVVADMPFMTYQSSLEDALKNAGRLMGEGRAHAVKLEGGTEIAQTVTKLVQAGIPVMGHIGLTPQSVHALGGFAVQGRTAETAERMLADALVLQEAGAFAIVLEMVPTEVAGRITQELSIPTIGIGAGPHCDGQVLVFHDMVGYTSGYIPKHNKRYANFADLIQQAASTYVDEVQGGSFPGEEQSVHLKPAELSQLTPFLKGDIQ